MSKQSKEGSRDELAELISGTINKSGKEVIAHYLDGSSTQTDVTDWVSTGSTMLDLAISNRPNGGFPFGKIVELTGLEASGKSLICAHTIANTQAKGGIGVYFDTESALNRDFLKAVGVDLQNMVYVPVETIESIFEKIEKMIEAVRKSKNNRDRLVTIVVDSLAGASTLSEIESDYKKDGYATDKAILLSKALRKITNLIAKEKILLILTNQLRTRMGVSFGDQWTTSGGKAVGYHSSVRLRLKQIGKLKDSSNEVIGIKTRAEVSKNRIGPPLRSVEFNIRFDRGISDYESWLDFCKKFDIVSQGGAWYTYVNESTGENMKFQSKDWDTMLKDDVELREELYKKICDEYITEYKEDGAGLEVSAKVDENDDE